MLKEKVYHLVERGSHGSKINLYFDYAIMFLIIANVIIVILESFNSIYSRFGSYLIAFEIFSVIVFSIEYLMRLWVSDITHPAPTKTKSFFKFIFSFYGIIDLLAILPFYLPFVVKIDLKFLRILRLMRFFRIFKFNRYNSSLNLIWQVIKEKRTELGITGFLTFLVLLIASFLMYYIEGDVQPEQFPNILACLWWAVATLTTVGYGDVYPITGLGKVVSGTIALLGIGVVALPTGIIGSAFMEKVSQKNKQAKQCPHCGKQIH
ncbi:ion transporter [Sunxiuqinia indica]|uniref:ion transporter n=1 Tax=Sunxiuqinia indica TaxID=2692584 RepID=UPI0013582807|nr:ion transporter [Sunxiuqinia indica]